MELADGEQVKSQLLGLYCQEQKNKQKKMVCLFCFLQLSLLIGETNPELAEKGKEKLDLPSQMKHKSFDWMLRDSNL